LVVTGWPPLHRTDLSFDNTLNAWVAARPAVTTTWRVVTNALQPLTWEVLAVIAAFLLWRAQRRKVALYVLVAIFGTLAWYDIVKAAVGRSRPTVPVPLLYAQGASFPSGHAMMSAVAMTLASMGAWHLLRKQWARILAVTGAIVIAAAVAFSRLALGVHYLSDVLAAWLLAGAWMCTLAAVFGVAAERQVRPPTPP
jgi:undecaprenyl-diphosphatase